MSGDGSFEILCSTCSKRLKAMVSMAGKTATCPSCGTKLIIPNVGGGAPGAGGQSQPFSPFPQNPAQRPQQPQQPNQYPFGQQPMGQNPNQPFGQPSGTGGSLGDLSSFNFNELAPPASNLSPPNLNPYSPPPMSGGFSSMGGPRGGTQYAKSKVTAPAMILLVLSIITVVVRIGGIATDIYFLATGNLVVPIPNGQQAPQPQPAFMAGAIAANVFALAMSGITAYGAFMMSKLENYSLARTSAILSVIPFCAPCVCLGIPFGIWALVVLQDPQVKSAFR